MGIALTRDFKETVVARVRRDPKFKQALFTEGAREAARHGKGGVKEALLTLGPLRAVERRIILLLIPASEEGKSDFDLPPVRAAE